MADGAHGFPGGQQIRVVGDLDSDERPHGHGTRLQPCQLLVGQLAQQRVAVLVRYAVPRCRGRGLVRDGRVTATAQIDTTTVMPSQSPSHMYMHNHNHTTTIAHARTHTHTQAHENGHAHAHITQPQWQAHAHVQGGTAARRHTARHTHSHKLHPQSQSPAITRATVHAQTITVPTYASKGRMMRDSVPCRQPSRDAAAASRSRNMSPALASFSTISADSSLHTRDGWRSRKPTSPHSWLSHCISTSAPGVPGPGRPMPMGRSDADGGPRLLVLSAPRDVNIGRIGL